MDQRDFIDFNPPACASIIPIVPVFIPFAGCPHKCIFCSQEKQTGIQQAQGIDDALYRLDVEMERRALHSSPPCEIAFYGGTFTMLPDSDIIKCLDQVALYKKSNQCIAIRCSTRPDAVNKNILTLLKDKGMDTIELGIQSFDDVILYGSGRGYNGRVAESGCRAVRDAGFRLGVQLLPGLPKSTNESFLSDVMRSISLHPDFMRFYPCITVKDTPLEKMYRNGEYTPWSLEYTIDALGHGLAMSWNNSIPVIRLSVAHEASFELAVIAGPRHPALGNMIQSYAIFLCVLNLLEKNKDAIIRIPARLQGMIFGYKGSMREVYASKQIDIKREGTSYYFSSKKY